MFAQILDRILGSVCEIYREPSHQVYLILASKWDILDQWLVVTWLALSGACDILIAGAIATSLFFSRTGVRA